MATLNEMIAQGAQFNVPDPVAQYNKLAQMQQYKTQNELSQQEAIDKATERQRLVSERTRRATFLSGLSGKLAEKGYTLDRSTLSSMMSSGIPDIEKLAFEGFKALSADEAFNKAEGEPSATMAAAPTPAPMAAAVPRYDSTQPNVGVGTTGVPGVGMKLPFADSLATRLNPTTGEAEPVPLRENQAAAGLFDKLTKTYSPVFGTLALTAPEIVTRLNNKLTALTNNPPEGMTPQTRAEMIAAVKEEIIATAAGKRDMLTPTNAMAPQAPAPVANAMAPAPTPAAAPTGELERLTAQRNRYSKISPQTPGDVAKLKNILDGIDKQIERLTTTGSSLSKLIAERDRLPAGDPRIATFDNAILKESQNVAKTEPLADFAAFMRLSTADQDAFLKFKRAGAACGTIALTTGAGIAVKSEGN